MSSSTFIADAALQRDEREWREKCDKKFEVLDSKLRTLQPSAFSLPGLFRYAHKSHESHLFRRMLKMARLLTRPTPARQDAPFRAQGRRRVETGGGTDRTPWGRSPVQWILVNGKTPLAFSTSENLNRYVEDFDESRTTLMDFFSILL